VTWKLTVQCLYLVGAACFFVGTLVSMIAELKGWK
jgi:hypothetical protein